MTISNRKSSIFEDFSNKLRPFDQINLTLIVSFN